jgi:hypothetical protein
VQDHPYLTDKAGGGAGFTLNFTLPYATLEAFMPLAQEQLVASRLPPLERWAARAALC